MVDFQVSGMCSETCEERVRKAVVMVDASATVTIDRVSGHVFVETVAEADSLRQAIEREGYVVERVIA